MDIKKKLDNIAIHSLTAGFSGTLIILSVKAINYVFDIGPYQETFPALLGFSALLGIGILFLLVSAFQIIANSVKKLNTNPAPSESSFPTTPSDGKQG